jgi:Outer membrane protein beta-barrel domain
MKYSILALLGFFWFQTLSAQNDLHVGLNLGYPIGGFDESKSAYHVGVHPTYRFNRLLSGEVQVSFSKATYDRSTDIFGHDGGSTTNFNALAGLRLYILGEKYQVRPYLNFLVGYGKGYDQVYNKSNVLIKDEDGPGSVSLGVFLEIKHRVHVGLCVEGPWAFIVPKIGVSF